MIELICQRCSKSFRVKPSGADTKYCSKDCYLASLPKRVEKVCGHCGKPFSVPPCNAHFQCCSDECRMNYWVGPRASNWKGGRDTPTSPATYISISVGKNTRRPEHVVLAERALGKALPRGAEVHHLDGNRQNNTPSNLVICENRQYHLMLEARGKRLRELGSLELKRCEKCHDVKPLAEFNLNCRSWDDRQYICRPCANEAKRAYRKAKHHA